MAEVDFVEMVKQMDNEEMRVLTLTARALKAGGEAKDRVKRGGKWISLTLSTTDGGFDKADCENRIRELQSCMLDLVKESTKSTESNDSLDSKFKEISDEIKSLQDAIQNHESHSAKMEKVDSQLDEILTLLETQDLNLAEYDESLARRLIEEVKVLSEDKVLIVFKGGIKSEQLLRQ